MQPIPEWLRPLTWYPCHCAWMLVIYGAVRHDPAGAEPVRADLRGAVLRGAELRGADLRCADLTDAVLSGAVLRGAVLSGADLSGALLRGALLRGALLRGADLSGADLSGAHGIRSAGPVGAEGRMIYGVAHPGGAMIQAGCWWGTVPATVAAIEARYADGTGREQYRAAYLAAVHLVGGGPELTRDEQGGEE